jgi:hypothetical protein
VLINQDAVGVASSNSLVISWDILGKLDGRGLRCAALALAFASSPSSASRSAPDSRTDLKSYAQDVGMRPKKFRPTPPTPPPPPPTT